MHGNAWEGWAQCQKSLNDKLTYSELALRLTCNFTRQLSNWWDKISKIERVSIIQSNYPNRELIKAISAEFYANTKRSQALLKLVLFPTIVGFES